MYYNVVDDTTEMTATTINFARFKIRTVLQKSTAKRYEVMKLIKR